MSESSMKPARVNPLLRHANEERRSLDGDWRFRLDPLDCGASEGWFRSRWRLSESIRVPGCWQGQGFGDESKDRVWDFNLETRVFRATYKGTGWYATSFRVPAEWTQKRLWLNFGGVHPSAEVWLNGKRLGANGLPFVPFAFEITGYVSPNSDNELVVRVHEHNREFGLAFNWQGNWSGLYRGVDLTATGPACIARCAVLPYVSTQSLLLRVSVDDNKPKGAHRTVSVCVSPVGIQQEPITAEFEMPADMAEFVVSVPNPRQWTPDSPQLYRIDVIVKLDSTISDARSERVGFVQFEARGRQMFIGGEPYYLRGTGDFISCPETGSPDADRDRWRRKLQALRDYGYNYVRCQSFVYGPEYYDVADELGILVQSEMGALGAWGGSSSTHVYQWPKPTADNYPTLKEQWDLVVERDACHPSAAIYCMSNELWDSTDFPRVAWECYRSTKSIKPGALVIWTDGGYNKDLPGDFINHVTKMLKPDDLAALDKPMIEHEYAWWSSFPDVRLRAKYTGAMRPYAMEIAAEAAACQNQARLLEIYARNSQQLQFIESKAKMEILRRDTPALAGINHFNAMDCNPSPQGIIDEFYGRKLVDAATWRQTNGDTVALCSLGFDDRCWTSGESATVSFSVSDFAHPPLREPRLSWRLSAGREILDSGEVEFAHTPFSTVPAGQIVITAPSVAVPVAAQLEVTIADRDDIRNVRNQWAVWLFPETPSPIGAAVYGQPRRTWLDQWPELPSVAEIPPGTGPGVLLTEALDDNVIVFMQRGGRVILVTNEGLVRPHSPLFGYVKYFFTPPANYSPYEDGQNGTVIAAHPMLGALPHEGFADWQFFRVIDNAPPLDLKPLGLSDGDPVIRVIHRYPTLHPLAYLVERRVAKGALLVCALELKQEWTEARWLLNQLCSYAASADCRPDLELNAASLARIAAAST